MNVGNIASPNSIPLEKRKCGLKFTFDHRELSQVHERGLTPRVQLQSLLEILTPTAGIALLIGNDAQNVVGARQPGSKPGYLEERRFRLSQVPAFQLCESALEQ